MKVIVTDEISEKGLELLQNDSRVQLDVRLGLSRSELHEVIGEYDAIIERVFKLTVRAWDWNCPQHITPRYRLDEIAAEIQKLNPDFVKSCCPEINE